MIDVVHRYNFERFTVGSKSAATSFSVISIIGQLGRGLRNGGLKCAIRGSVSACISNVEHPS